MPPIDDALGELADATASLIDGLGGLTDEQAREPSRLPGWTRGHVLTHLARNAEGGVRLLTGVRTGEGGREYRSVADRTTDIEDGAGRPAAELVADVRKTAGRFALAAAIMPAQAWERPVTWTTGQRTPASLVIWSRLAEVQLHHVDLDLGFGPADWPAEFVAVLISKVVDTLNERNLAPVAARLTATDTGRSFRIGDGEPGLDLTGTEAALLAWLVGRSDGADLGGDRDGPLPPVPSIYYT
jgi:maleylpyruvate isomerase